MKTITTEYAGITITYDESRNVWVFEKNGRERSSGSLALAREAIDKPDPVEKKPFARVKAWKRNHPGWHLVDVTSVIGDGGPQGSYWIMDGKHRSKERGYSLYAHTAHNRDTIQKIQAIQAERGKLSEESGKLEVTLLKFTDNNQWKQSP